MVYILIYEYISNFYFSPKLHVWSKYISKLQL